MTRPATLLAVDDNPTELTLVSHTLLEAFPGARILDTMDPCVAPALCVEHEFDCVVLDYNMPRMNGLMLVQALRAAHPYLPIILTTSIGDEMLVARAMHIGASDYIPKSRINVESIKRAIVRSRKACEQARLIDEQRAELETFSYALAHDFKQPIRQIRTFTQLITAQLEGHETQQVRDHLAFLGQAALRLGALVDVMSQYTLLNEAPELTQVDLYAVIAGVSDALTPYIQERRATLEIAQDLPPVYGNAVLMAQVLQNLITNALHYNVSAAPKVTISAQTNAEECVLVVSDNGVGIEDKYLAEIFKPLVRLHAASQFAGTGFGLTIARKAMLAQHGSIWCESTPGVGSKFYVKLPLSSASPSPRAETDADADDATL